MEIFDYDNVLLLPRKCRVESRSECDSSVTLGNRTFRIPVVPANMKTVVNETICLWMAQNGYFYVMHRFDLDNVAFVRFMHAQGAFASISLGVKKPDYETVDQLAAARTLRVAHGLPLNGYVGTSISLSPAGRGPWRAWLLLVEALPAGTEGSPVARHLVRAAFNPPWDLPRAPTAAERQRLWESRPLRIPEGADPGRLKVVGWVEDAQGRIRAIAESRCLPVGGKQ